MPGLVQKMLFWFFEQDFRGIQIFKLKRTWKEPGHPLLGKEPGHPLFVTFFRSFPWVHS